MATETTDITIEILRRIQAEQAAHRADTRHLQQSFLDVARLLQRMDARFSEVEGRISDVKSDLETMFKMELIGQQAHLETRLEARFETALNVFEARFDTKIDGAVRAIADRLDAIQDRLPG